MAITHFIDTAASEIASARIKSLTNRVPEGFPVLLYGDTRAHNFIFYNSQTGTVESFSGDPTYLLRVTLGEVQLGPSSGSFTLTCGTGTTGAINALSDASTIQAALSALAQITTDGGVAVTGSFPNFIITWNRVGVVTGLSASAALLVPLSSVSLTAMQTGSASVVNQVALQLRQSAISSQSTWSVISTPNAGWTGTLTTNTAAAVSLLTNEGEQSGEFVEVGTCLTVEVLNPSGFPTSYYQTPVILRAKNLDPNNAVSPPISGYALGDTLYGNANNTLSVLPGNNTTQRKFYLQVGDGTNSAAPNWTTIQASDLPNSELPGAPNTAVQVNIGGAFTGYPDFTYEPTTKVLSALRYTGTFTNGVNASNVNTGVIPSAQLPLATLAARGAILNVAPVANQWIDYIDATGAPHLSQPNASNLSGLGVNIATFLSVPNSQNLRFAVTDETGTGGGLVFATAPNLTTPNIGTASGNRITLSDLTSGRVAFSTAGGQLTDSANLTFNSGTGILTATGFIGTLNGNTFTTGTYTLTGAAGKTLTFNNSITLAGTDAQTYTFPTTSATIARTDAANTFTGTQTFSNAISYGGVTLSAAVTGTGNMVLSAGPTLTGTTIAATITASGVISTSDATASSSTTTGSGVFGGGVGIAGRLNVGARSSITDLATGNAALDLYGLTNGGSSLRISNSAADVTSKSSKIGTRPYTIAQSDVFMIGLDTANTSNTLYLGGSTSTHQTVTSIEFYTAAAVNTATGTRAGLITNAGVLTWNTATEATTGGAGSITTAGGIYATKKFITASTLTTGAPNGGTAAEWKFGTVVTGVTSTFVSTNYIQIDVAGTLYKLATVTSIP